MKVYITNYSLSIITKAIKDKLQLNYSNSAMIEEIYKGNELNKIISNLGYFFNMIEIKEIFVRQLLLKDLEYLVTKIKDAKGIIERFVEFENDKYKKKIKAPAYHKDYECKWMRKDFENTLKATGENVKYENSGVTSIDNIKLTDGFINIIKNKYTQLTFDFGENEEVLKNLKYAPSYKINDILKNPRYKNKEEIINNFFKTKKEIRDNIFNYFVEIYNPELGFSKTILDEIGFRPCMSCYNPIMKNVVEEI